MSQPRSVLSAAIRREEAERDALRVQLAERLAELETLRNRRAAVQRDRETAQHWIATVSRPGALLPLAALSQTNVFLRSCERLAQALAEQQRAAQSRADGIRGEIAVLQSRVRALGRLVARRRAEALIRRQRGVERELDRDAAALGEALRALRAGRGEVWLQPQSLMIPKESSPWQSVQSA